MKSESLFSLLSLSLSPLLSSVKFKYVLSTYDVDRYQQELHTSPEGRTIINIFLHYHKLSYIIMVSPYIPTPL